MSLNQSELEFNLDQSQLDALKLETQSLTPEEATAFNEKVREAYVHFLDGLGEYIDQPFDIKEIEHRFIVTDSQTVLEFLTSNY